MGIQKTVGVLEALNERIKMAQEELRVVSAHNTGHSAGRVFSSIITASCVVAAVSLMIPAMVVCNSSNPDGAVGGAIFGIPSLLFWAWSLKRLARKAPDNAEHIPPVSA
jgi:Zn-dependent protease with chaperone function